MDAVEQRTRELRKEGELLHKNHEQQMSLNRDEERSFQVGGWRSCLGLAKVVVGGGWWGCIAQLTALKSLCSVLKELLVLSKAGQTSE